MSILTAKQDKINLFRYYSFSPEETKEHLLLLSHYQYVDEIYQFKHGRYLRWIHLQSPTKIHRGMFLCDILIGDKVCIKGRSFPTRFLNISFDECLFFQKFSNQELILLNAVDKL